MATTSLHNLPDEDLLQAFFEQEFQALQRCEGAQALPACARIVARLVLQGGDKAVGLARLQLGQWPSDSCPEARVWQ
jgi:hypothetical protein